MAVLYRKYRPQTFEQVVSQKPIVQTLKNQVGGGLIAHAYLFTGSRGVGKTSVARILAKAANCLSPKQGDACGTCGNCTAISAGSFLDLVEIDAASNTGVDNIRQLIEHVKFSPTLGKFKVFIVDEVHMLSKGAFNALLKTLEEPPKHAIFILATTEINKVPATIISRTQRFDFKALSTEELLAHLKQISSQEDLKFSDDILELVAQNSEGSARDALSLLDKLSTLGKGANIADSRQLLGVTDLGLCEQLLEVIALGQAEAVPPFFDQLAQKGVDYFIFTRDFLEYLRKLLIYKVSEGKITANLPGHSADTLKEHADKFSINNIIFTIRLFLKAYKDLSISPEAQIPLLLAGIEAALKKTSSSQSPSKSQAAPNVHIEAEFFQRTAAVSLNQPASESVKELKEPAHLTEFSGEISLEEAQNLWPKMLAKIKETNGPLASMLKASKLQAVERGKIGVGVKFAFDKQNIENSKNSALIVAVIESLIGKKIKISAQVIKTETKETGSAGEALSDALKIFGGEIIE